jgi:hypothetical protein
VKLGVDSYLHQNRAFGRIKVPDFKWAGYIDKAKYDALLIESGLVEATEQTTAAPEQTSAKLTHVEFGTESEDPGAGIADGVADFADDEDENSRSGRFAE